MTETRVKLVVATTNTGKLRELRELLAELPFEVLSVKEALGHELDVVEDSDTFEGNAALKARAVHHATGAMTLADDSGLEVDALEGKPGVHSARFSGDGATDASNRAALMRAIAEIPDQKPRARFRCALALIVPAGAPIAIDATAASNPTGEPSAEDASLFFFNGACEGHLVREERGVGGFGYDPLFVPDEGDGRTMAELSAETKNRISHRAHAFSALRRALRVKG